MSDLWEDEGGFGAGDAEPTEDGDDDEWDEGDEELGPGLEDGFDESDDDESWDDEEGAG